jgi:hypothetical protein
LQQLVFVVDISDGTDKHETTSHQHLVAGPIPKGRHVRLVLVPFLVPVHGPSPLAMMMRHHHHKNHHRCKVLSDYIEVTRKIIAEVAEL